MRFTLGVAGAAASVTFASIGDWGGASVGGYRATNEKEVAAQLAKTAKAKDISFVLNTGDNFYFCGVKDLSDTQFKTVFEDVFDDEALYVPWYGCFGNHDYAYDVKPQTEYKSPNKDRWQIPAPYYSKRIALSDSQHMTLIVLDTSPCYQDYINDDPSKWDPCSPEYASECKGPDGKCDFHENVLKADSCQKQEAWLKEELAKVPEGDWLIAMGHNPAYQIDVVDLTSLLLAKPMHLYLNGHVHYLSQYQYTAADGKSAPVNFITTGAGCMVYSHDQDQDGLFGDGDAGHSFVFNQKISGFTLHTFSDDFSELTTEFIDAQGNSLHSFVTKKDGSPAPSPSPPSPSPPAPSPSPSPAGKGTCAKHGCDYNPAWGCQCNYQCKAHGDCCDDFDKICPKNPASCSTYGCGRYNTTQTCQCNSYCKRHDDCCPDYSETCKKSVTYV